MEKLAAWSSAPFRASTRAVIRGSSASQPVVPVTTGMPAAISRSMLAGAASGRVNSIATSKPRVALGGERLPPAFSFRRYDRGFVASRRRQSGDRATHLPIPDDQRRMPSHDAPRLWSMTGTPQHDPKNSACSRRTTSGPSSSRTTNVMLIAEAPWEMTSTLAGWTARKIRAARPGRVPEPDPHHRDDGPVVLHPHLAQVGQLAHHGIQPGAVLHRERDAHLAAGEHVHHDLMPLEHLEHRPEKAVGAQHAGSPHVHHGDAALPGNRSDRGIAHPLQLRRRFDRGARVARAAAS